MCASKKSVCRLLVLLFATGAAALLGFPAVAADIEFRKPTEAESALLNLPLGLNKNFARIPVDNPITVDKIALGKALYFDTRLSRNDTIACATCHNPKVSRSSHKSTGSGADPVVDACRGHTSGRCQHNSRRRGACSRRQRHGAARCCHGRRARCARSRVLKFRRRRPGRGALPKR